MPAIRPRTVVVDGQLAFRMRRLRAAREGESGLAITSLPLLAAAVRRPPRRRLCMKHLVLSISKPPDPSTAESWNGLILKSPLAVR